MAHTSGVQRRGVLGTIERLLAATAVVGATGFVLINALYVEFYDDFGIRPEDVGWDRVTVAARAAWVAIAAIIGAGLVGYFVALLQLLSHRQEIANERSVTETEGVAEKEKVKNAIRVDFLRVRVRALSGILALMMAVAIIVSFIYMIIEVENDVDEVRAGHSVDGVGGFLAPLVDVSANRVEVDWLGDPQRAPSTLKPGTFVTYLGRGPSVAAFVICGRETVLVPATQVAVRVLLEKRDLDENRQEADFREKCPVSTP